MKSVVNPLWRRFSGGGCFLGRIGDGEDLHAAVARFCSDNGVETAAFQAGGTVSRITVGVFDPTQRVYVTYSDESPYEIAACSGTVTLQNGVPTPRAQIVVCDPFGKATGGRLFSPTRAVAVEIFVQALCGAPLSRVYDAVTGQDFWQDAGPEPGAADQQG